MNKASKNMYLVVIHTMLSLNENVEIINTVGKEKLSIHELAKR